MVLLLQILIDPSGQQTDTRSLTYFVNYMYIHGLTQKYLITLLLRVSICWPRNLHLQPEFGDSFTPIASFAPRGSLTSGGPHQNANYSNGHVGNKNVFFKMAPNPH